MSVTIPETHRDLLGAPVHVILATVQPDGQPQLTIVWASYDGTHILINTARGRQKDKNLTARPMATVFAVDPGDPYRWIEIRGVVDGATEEGAVDHIDALAQAYEGKSHYFGDIVSASLRDTMVRVIYKIKPVKVNYR
jgi:PPOX class probable F420-dependent enzyme